MRLAWPLTHEIDEADRDEQHGHTGRRDPQASRYLPARRPRECGRDDSGCSDAKQERWKIDGGCVHCVSEGR